MEIILKEDVQGLGYKNDLVNVKPGYARNYLIPQGLAKTATPSAKKSLEENLKQATHKAEKIKNDAQELANAMADLTLEVSAKISESGKIFGSVTTIQIADALNKALNGKGVETKIDRRKIVIDQKEVKQAGNYSVTVDLHREVKQTVNFTVVEG